jgi:carbamoyltransferase
MKDGFYLSTYLNPAGIHRIAYARLRHDNNISLWEKSGACVRLVRHWELERLSGQKMHRTPFLSLADEKGFIDRLLAPLDLKCGDMAEIWGTPDLATSDDYHLARELPDIAFHSVSHLYSAALMDSDVFFDGTIVGLAVDRGPDRVLDRRLKDRWFAGGVVKSGSVSIFPAESPGALYCEARDRFGKREGTLMALATATTAAGRSERDQILADHLFDNRDVVEQSRRAFERIYGQVRADYSQDPRFTPDESLQSAVMKEIQAISIMIMERNIDRILEEYEVDPTQAHLAIAGGYALNCPTNSYLMEKYNFQGLLIPPCPGDDGQSMGIGLAAFHKKMGRFDFSYPGPYLGREDTDLEGALNTFGEYIQDVRRASSCDEDTIVDDLLRGPVVWFWGRSEVGPRALGNRSILGDPTSTATKDALNRVKQREWWRPVAPIVLADRLDEWFENARPSPYMLETFTIREPQRSRIPAVAHLDYSARIQSLTREQNSALYDLVAAFGRRTGVPIICNTSLNDKGEPIIDTIPEAINFCLRKQIPVAYFNGNRVAFRNFSAYGETGPRPRAHELFSEVDPKQARAVAMEANPHGLPPAELYLYLTDLELSAQHDIRTTSGAAKVREILSRRMAADPGLLSVAERAMKKNRVHFSAYGWQPLIPDGADVEADDV